MVTELNQETFKEAVSGEPILVDFWASWCGPCKMLGPVFEELSGEYEGRLKFAKLSTEDFPDVAEEHHITGIPCLILFKDGKEIDRIVGNLPKEQLKEKIDGIINKI